MLKDHTVNIESRRYHHGDLRAALLDAGLALLAIRKADDLSLREVARSVGVSANAVYRHFPDKAALMRALATEGLRALAIAQHAAADAAGGGAAGFEATGRAYVRFALANPALFRLILSNPAHGDLLSEPAGDVPDAMTFLRANAEIVAGATGNAKIIALRAWSQAHGLAMLLLDAQVSPDDAIIDAVFAPDINHSVRVDQAQV
jgi:AcrR family transcriptional regulator